MKQKRSGNSVDTSCSTPQSAAGMAIKKLSCELEIRGLGKKPKPTGRNRRNKILKHIADGTSKLEYNYALIDYKNNNEVIKKSVMTRHSAFCKNKALEGSGIAWALVDS